MTMSDSTLRTLPHCPTNGVHFYLSAKAGHAPVDNEYFGPGIRCLLL